MSDGVHYGAKRVGVPHTGGVVLARRLASTGSKIKRLKPPYFFFAVLDEWLMVSATFLPEIDLFLRNMALFWPLACGAFSLKVWNDKGGV